MIYLRFQQDPSDLMLTLDRREQEQRREHPFGGQCSDWADDDGSWDRSRGRGRTVMDGLGVRGSGKEGFTMTYEFLA